jgi:hypothetical protein
VDHLVSAFEGLVVLEKAMENYEFSVEPLDCTGV